MAGCVDIGRIAGSSDSMLVAVGRKEEGKMVGRREGRDVNVLWSLVSWELRGHGRIGGTVSVWLMGLIVALFVSLRQLGVWRRHSSPSSSGDTAYCVVLVVNRCLNLESEI
jgi:hypothetical protein